MTKLQIVTFLCTLAVSIPAQNLSPNLASYPKDSTLSFPEQNFEVLWQTFEDNYAFFKLRNVDWKKAYEQWRPIVTANTTEDSLFGVFCAMLAPFQDHHVNVVIPGKKAFKSGQQSRFDKEFPTDSLRLAFWNMVDNTLSKRGFNKLKFIGPELDGKRLFSYSKSIDYGYLRFDRCVSRGIDSDKDAKEAGRYLDKIFEDFEHLNGLILDVRNNGGGFDQFSFEVAGRFTQKNLVGMYKRTRKRGGKYEEYVGLEDWHIEPKGKTSFHGPVVVLTNGETLSAADVFALIMKELPQVRIIGENSCGVYSDMYVFTLPNNWFVSLSNQIYYDVNNICYEGIGTPVDIVVENNRKDLVEMNDPVLLRAFIELRVSNGARNQRQ